SGGERQMQHRPIAQTLYAARIRCIEQRLDLGSSQIVDELVVGLLHWDGMNRASLIETGDHAILEEAEERLDGRQSCVTSLRTAVTGSLQMAQELQDQRRVKLLDLKGGWQCLEAIGGETHEQLDRVGVGLARVNTRASFDRQMLAQKGTEMHTQPAHDGSPRCRVSAASAICPISRRVACRYQYVSDT